MNFVPGSVRQLSIETATSLASGLRGRCQRVAVVRDASADEIRQLLAAVELDAVQFHGAETPEFCRQFDRPYVKVVAVEQTASCALDDQVGTAAQAYHDACALLLDTSVAGASGGTGEGFDWSRWPVQRPEMPLVLAGGLNPDNVAAAIRATDCAAVDVAGGVDGLVRGVKDLARIEAFVAAVRGVQRDK